MEDLDEYYDFDNILRRMLDKVPDSIDKREGSIIFDALAPVAAELAQMYIVLKDNIDLVFVDTAIGEYLDRLCNQIGIERKQATKAIRKAKFYNEENTLINIAIGERFTLNDLTYQAIKKLSEGVYECECETAGKEGNKQFGTLIPINYIQGLGKAVLEDILIPGEDEETDEALRKRYFESINEKAFAGNIADYKKKTKELQGVSLVKVTPVWNGGGTVKLTILDSDYNKASSQLINSVQEQICPDMSNSGLGLAPIGHVVTVDTVEEQQINVSTTVTITEGSNMEDIKTNIINEVSEYLLELRKTWENEDNLIVRISQIESRILNITGILDITGTQINNGTSNIELLSNEIPVLGNMEVDV